MTDKGASCSFCHLMVLLLVFTLSGRQQNTAKVWLMLKAHLKCVEKKWDRTKTIPLIYFPLRQTNWSKLIKQVSKSLRAFEQEIKTNHISEVLISSHTKTAFSLLLRTHFYITPLKPRENENAKLTFFNCLTEATVQFS